MRVQVPITEVFKIIFKKRFSFKYLSYQNVSNIRVHIFNKYFFLNHSWRRL